MLSSKRTLTVVLFYMTGRWFMPGNDIRPLFRQFAAVQPHICCLQAFPSNYQSITGVPPTTLPEFRLHRNGCFLEAVHGSFESVSLQELFWACKKYVEMNSMDGYSRHSGPTMSFDKRPIPSDMELRLLTAFELQNLMKLYGLAVKNPDDKRQMAIALREERERGSQARPSWSSTNL